MSEKKGSRNGGLKKAIIGLAVAVALVAFAIALFQYKSPLERFLTPKSVGEVTADVCYANVGLQWDAVDHATGYEIQEKSAGGDYETIGSIEGENGYIIEGYDRESEHEYRVVPYAVDPFNGSIYEGEPSEAVEAYYDSSKYAQKIPILSYHHIMPAGETPPFAIFIAVDKLQEQMDYLHDEGFTTLTPDEFRLWYEGKKEFPKKTCMITFDDGIYTTYHLLYPMLKEYDMAATVFCIGHVTGDTTDDYDPDYQVSHYVGTDVIDRLKTEYPRMSFESHTFNMHKRVKGKEPVDFYTYDQMMDDFEKNAKFGFEYIAYPRGRYNDDLVKVVKDNGFKLGFTYDPFYYATREDDPYAINRIRVSGRISLENFEKMVNGEDEKYDH